MKKIITLGALSLSLLFSFPLWAQKKPIPGYYISLQGDTIKGVFPSFRDWSNNPDKVDFIPAGSSVQMLLTPQNVNQFHIEGYEEYFSYTGERLINPILDQVVLNDRFSDFSLDLYEPVVGFLRLVTRTPAGNLYVLHDTKRINFYLQLPGQPLIELKFKKTVEGNRVIEFAEFRKQLNDHFSEVIIQNKLSGRLERLLYSENHLVSFFQSLFPSVNTIPSKKTVSSNWVISAGLTVNSIIIKDEHSIYSGPENFSTSVSPLISIGYMSAFDRKFGKYFLYPQLKLSKYKNTAEVKQGSFTSTTIYKVDLLITWQMSGGANLVNKENFKLFITGNIGVSGQVGGRQIGQMYRASDNTPYGEATVYKMRGLTYSIDASTGITLNKRYLIYLTYLIPSSIANFTYHTPQLSGVQLRAGYKF